LDASASFINNKVFCATYTFTSIVTAATLPANIALHSSVIMNNYLIIIGGSSGWTNSNLNTKHYYMLINTVDGTLGSVLSGIVPTPMKRYSAAAVVFNNKMYLVMIKKQINHFVCSYLYLIFMKCI
jgi:hypothetical protein